MEIAFVIIFLGLLIFSAHLFNALFDKTKIPNVLLFLIIGIIIGPVTGWVTIDDFGQVGAVFSTLTLVVLLFESGINLKIQQLISSISSAFLLTIINFILGTIVATAVAYYFTDLSKIPAAFFGVIVAGTSSAVVIPMVRQLKMNDKGGTILLLESALTDVLCLVIGLALLSSMKKGIVEFSSILSSIVSSFIIALIIGIIGGLAWSLILDKVRAIQNHSFTSLAFVFIIYGLTELMEFNGGIATLAFGIALGNAGLLQKTPIAKWIPPKELWLSEKNLFSEIVFVLQTYFFVYVGVCIQFGSISTYFMGFAIVAGILILRPLTVKLLIKKNKMEVKDLSIMSIMSPKGLVPAILASIPLQLGLTGGETIQNLAYAVVLLSILICSVLIMWLGKGNGANDLFQFLFRKEKETDEKENHTPSILLNTDTKGIKE